MPRRVKKPKNNQTDFLSLISHKLHTPLAVVHLKASMLLDGTDGELNEKQRRSLEEVMRYAQELRWSIEKLLVFSDMDRVGPSAAPRPVNLSSYVPWAVERIVREVGSSRVRLAIGKVIPGIKLRMNEVYIDLILRNLIENAVKFCDKPEIVIAVGLEKRGSDAVISIGDNGPGITPAQRKRIFEPFYQIEANASGQVQGIGLGLALVKRLAQAHGGRVELQSELCKGTTILVRLPAQS